MEALATDRGAVQEDLLRAATPRRVPRRPDGLALVRRRVRDGEGAAQAHRLAKRLHATEVPRLLERADALIAGSRFRPFGTVGELGVYLKLLLDIRETLDKFQPSVFDRSLGELIIATGPRRDVEGDVERQPPAPQAASRRSTCGPACTSPTCTTGCGASSSSGCCTSAS